MAIKFLCDEMCQELGRWLRTAGYDTAIIDTPMDDHKIYEQAVQEKRLLLTRDKMFKTYDPSGKIVIYLKEESLDGWAAQLKEMGVDWLFAPFTRCLECNVMLTEIPDQKWECPTCKKVFWRGSHTDRMENKLKGWQG